MIVVTPQCRADATWEPSLLLSLVDYMQEKFAVDPDRVYGAGYSMGGFGCWELAMTAPERFAALVPVAGGGDSSDAERLVNLPIWAFHGANDQVVPLESTKAMIEAVQRVGGQTKLTIYNDRGHNTCDVTFCTRGFIRVAPVSAAAA
jgi:predicted peptidase